MDVLTTLADVDARLDEAERAWAISDDAFRAALGRFRYQPELPNAPTDPFSDEYRAFQLVLYRQLTGRDYGVANEETKFDAESAFQRPWPYATRSPRTVGDSLVSYGFFIREMNLPPGAQILEMGSGYGSLSMNLALTGYRVTCVDMSRALLDVIERRARQLGVEVETRCAGMADVALDRRYDAVIFHESFHHCLDHQRLVGRLGELVAPGGRVFFAAEPIVEDGNPLVPYPWGLRLDGLSLLSTRRWGWMELGYKRSYFFELLRRHGWSVDYTSLRYAEWANLYTAQRASERAPTPKRTPKERALQAVELAATSARCVLEEGWPVFLRRAWSRIAGY